MGQKETKLVNQPIYLIKATRRRTRNSRIRETECVLNDSSKNKSILFAFAAGGGLAEHVAPFDATIQIISGTATLTVWRRSVVGKPGTWIQMVLRRRIASKRNRRGHAADFVEIVLPIA